MVGLRRMPVVSLEREVVLFVSVEERKLLNPNLRNSTSNQPLREKH
jgi:hypothetical protein